MNIQSALCEVLAHWHPLSGLPFSHLRSKDGMLCFLPALLSDQFRFFHLQVTETKGGTQHRGEFTGKTLTTSHHRLQGRPEPSAPERVEKGCSGHPSNGKL